MIECSRDCVKTLDLDGHLLSMNAGGMETLEICELAPFVGGSWIDFWNGEDRESARAAVIEAREPAASGGSSAISRPSRRRTPLWFDVVVSPILDTEGRPERLIAVSRDITEPEVAPRTSSGS